MAHACIPFSLIQLNFTLPPPCALSNGAVTALAAVLHRTSERSRARHRTPSKTQGHCSSRTGFKQPASRATRGMGGRAAWKGPYVAVSLLKDVIAVARQHPEWWNKTRFQGAPAPAIIRTQSRSSVVLPDFLKCVFFVHNGSKRMTRIEVSENMVGHKFGEFAPTRKMPIHKDSKKK